MKSVIGLIPKQSAMLLTANGAMTSVVISDVWKTAPYMALLLLAGLQVIDRGLYESASIDGAGPFKTFFRITLPLIKPSLLVALLFRTMDAFRVHHCAEYSGGHTLFPAFGKAVFSPFPAGNDHFFRNDRLPCAFTTCL